MRCPATGLRTVDHDRARASAGHTAAALHDRIKGLLVVVWNTLACGSRDPRHLAAPSLSVLRLAPATISHRPQTSRPPSAPRSSCARGDGDGTAGGHLSRARCSRTAWANA